jgi:predicted HicB family RNase H-like nuclease
MGLCTERRGFVVEMKIRCDPRIKKQLERAAGKRTHLSMNAYLNEIIIEYLKSEKSKSN